MRDVPAVLGTARSNNFDALRFLFAALVILNHSSVVFSGIETRDPLYRLFNGQIDAGALAVDAFFAISGYLIALSWLHAPSPGSYLRKRAVRIYPGFLVASALSLLIVAPLGGARLSALFAPSELVKGLLRMLFLSEPRGAGAFDGMAVPAVNSPLWTIRYEFLCYLAAPIVLFLCLRAGRWVVLALLAVALGAHAWQGTYRVFEVTTTLPLLGEASAWPRFATFFLAGMAIERYRDVLRFRRSVALLAAAALAVTGLWTGGFHVALATAGVYLLFWVAFDPAIPLAGFGRRGDFSYGLYLYGWPIQQLLAYYFGADLSPAAVFAITLPSAFLCATLSWHLVERPWLRRKRAEAGGATPPKPAAGAALPAQWAQPAAPPAEAPGLPIAARGIAAPFSGGWSAGPGPLGR